MRFSAIIEYVFHLVFLMTPAVTIMMVLVLLARRMLGNRQDPRLFYFLWVVLTIRLLIPWFPTGEFSLWSAVPSFPDPSLMLTDAEHMPAITPVISPQSEPTLFAQQDIHIDWMQVALWIWLLGAIIAGAFFTAIHWQFRRALLRQSKSIDWVNHDLNTCLEQCKEKLDMRTSISLSATALVSSPAIVGLFKPKILIPNALQGKLNHQEWTCIFMHELTHIRRKDVLWNGLMIMLVVMHWFNPFVWKAYFTMREDQELSCDATMKKHLHPIQYGRTLTKMVEIRSGLGRYSPISFISGTNITKRRIHMLFSKKRTIISFLMVACIAIASALILTNPNIRANAESSTQKDSFAAPAEGTITSHYGEETKHNVYAVSIANQAGTPVYATADGLIEKSGYEKGDGNQIVIVHSDSYESVYSHLEEIMVTEGQEVKKGQQIGTMGATGRTTGIQLSFEILKDGQSIDPETIIDFNN